MLNLLEKIYSHAKETPHKTAIVDQGGKRATSYSELIEISAKLAAWLRLHGLGREKVVVIQVPRGVEYIASRLASMMIGAAWVGVEDIMGAERIAYIIKDSGAKLSIDERAFFEAMKEEPLPVENWADPQPHDMAFIFYTSGSTGRAKGVIEEYGIYENIMFSTYRSICRYMPLNYANIAPETFIGGLYLMSGILSTGNTLHLIPLAMVRDPSALLTYFKEHNVQASCMPPTLVKALESAGKMELKVLHITGEIAVDLYIDRFPVMNAYGPTEFSYLPFFFDIDKPYKNTPIGTPDENTKLLLLNEDGSINPEEGELCIRLPYFRGYLHDDSRNCFITIDGVAYFKTSDYMSVDDAGNYTILGRVDDMVKINGNRIEPAEVEFAVKEVLHSDFAAVKVWERGGTRYLCAYHNTGQILEPAEMAEKLKDKLPLYMIPSCYVAIDEIPLNENGKVDKKALPEPQGSFRTVPYAAPETELEKNLCELFKAALDGEIGIDDDFFMLGGDSVKAIAALANCDIKGLTVQIIYEGRTVRKIASIIKDAPNLSAEGTDIPEYIPLNASQRFLLTSDLMESGTCTLNFPYRFELQPGTNLEKIASAISTAVSAHPSLLCTIEKKDDAYYLHYKKDAAFPLAVEEMTDDELERAAESFARPFGTDDTPLIRCRVINGTGRQVVLLDVSHLVCDAFSLLQLLDDIASAFDGEEPGKDHCLEFMQAEADFRNTERYRKDMEYFEKLYDQPGWDVCPKPDRDEPGNIEDELFLAFDFSQEGVNEINNRFGIGKCGLYMAAAALAISAYNDSENIMFTWIWHGRADAMLMNSVGCFYKDLPISFRLKQGLVLSALYEDISIQVRDAVSHSNVCYWEEKGGYLVCLQYQGDLFEYSYDDIVTDIRKLPVSSAGCDNIMNINILDGHDDFGVLFDYNAKKYDRESIERFGKLFCKICGILLASDPDKTTVGDIRHGDGSSV